jgi:hypothetical protein
MGIGRYYEPDPESLETMTEQEIRVEALDQAVQSLARHLATTDTFISRAKVFEAYLREGK